MSNEEPIRSNPLEQLKDDIRALQNRERRWAAVVQVPRVRANALVGMNAERWREGSRGFLSDDEIDDLLSRTSAQGAVGLNGLSFGPTRIVVAEGVEDDCDAITILEGRPLD